MNVTLPDAKLKAVIRRTSIDLVIWGLMATAPYTLAPLMTVDITEIARFQGIALGFIMSASGIAVHEIMWAARTGASA